MVALLSRYPPQRSIVGDGRIWSEPLFREIAELGFFDITTPEACGGLGLTELDLAVVDGGFGRGPVPVPFSSSICLAAEVIPLGGSELQKERWLPLLATGKAVGTVAPYDEVLVFGGTAVPARWENGVLNGINSPVPYAAPADIILVAFQSDAGPLLVLIARNASGLFASPPRGINILPSRSRLAFRQTQAEPLSGDGASILLDALTLRAATYTAFEQLGGADARPKWHGAMHWSVACSGNRSASAKPSIISLPIS